MLQVLHAKYFQIIRQMVKVSNACCVFDQLLGAARTQKLVKTFFSAVFQLFLFIFKLFQ